MSDTPVFDAYSRYYDLLYQDKDYAAEVAYVRPSGWPGIISGLGAFHRFPPEQATVSGVG